MAVGGFILFFTLLFTTNNINFYCFVSLRPGRSRVILISTTNLDACVRVSVCVQNLTNFCPYGLNSTPIST